MVNEGRRGPLISMSCPTLMRGKTGSRVPYIPQFSLTPAARLHQEGGAGRKGRQVPLSPTETFPPPPPPPPDPSLLQGIDWEGAKEALHLPPEWNQHLSSRKATCTTGNLLMVGNGWKLFSSKQENGKKRQTKFEMPPPRRGHHL